MAPAKSQADQIKELREWQIAHDVHCQHQKLEIQRLENELAKLVERVEKNTSWRIKLDGGMVALNLILVVFHLLIALGWIGVSS